ncbi:uncharacterized protein LOC120346152 isoform X2 [Styela clava]|uniref:uncharacterized protein LOC120346152 isoform X2 n=1 Tax=Styela clava TaxID=7725 RepID=UPI00193A14FA|nr:uncharacterized protein LOC120346152 isoform X2 [Styela clava]
MKILVFVALVSIAGCVSANSLACKRKPTVLDDCAKGEMVTPMQCLARKCSWCVGNVVIKCVKDTPDNPETMKALLLAIILSHLMSRSQTPKASLDGYYGPAVTLDEYSGPVVVSDGNFGPSATLDGYFGPSVTLDDGPAVTLDDGPAGTLDGYSGPSVTLDGGNVPQGDASLSPPNPQFLSNYPQGEATLSDPVFYGGVIPQGDETLGSVNSQHTQGSSKPIENPKIVIMDSGMGPNMRA